MEWFKDKINLFRERQKNSWNSELKGDPVLFCMENTLLKIIHPTPPSVENFIPLALTNFLYSICFEFFMFLNLPKSLVMFMMMSPYVSLFPRHVSWRGKMVALLPVVKSATLCTVIGALDEKNLSKLKVK